MKEITNKELIKQAKDLIDLGLKNQPYYFNKMEFITFIRIDRRLLNAIIRQVKNGIYKSQLFEAMEFRKFIDREGYYKIIDINDSKDSTTMDISSLYANLEVIYTVMIYDNDMYLTNDMTIRLRNDPDNEVWLYEDELLELCK